MTQSKPSGVIVSQSDSELMPNYQASTTVSALHPISTVHDADGNPAIFSIGSDGQLWLCYRDRDESTGWTQVSFGQGPLAGIRVAAFDSAQLPTGEWAVALADAPDDGQSSRVYFTGWLSNDFKGTDWTAFSGNWIERDAEIPTDPDALDQGSQAVQGAAATGVLMGNQGSADRPATIVVVVQEGDSANHYFVNGDPSSTAWSWAVYPMPENPDRILDIAFGYLSAGPGVVGTYVLYELNGTRELYFVGAVAPVADQSPYNLKLDVEQGAACLGTLADPVAPHYSNLYVGGTGVRFYAHQTQPLAKAAGGGSGVLLPGSDGIPSINELVLAQDAENISLWVRDPSTQALWYSSGPQPQQSDPGVWSMPISLQQHVAHLSALRHPTRHANQLVCALTDNQLSYQWQDGATTLWQDSEIPLGDGGAAREFSSYTTVVHLEDDKQSPLAGMDVEVTASQWSYVTMNGYLWELSPDQPVEARTDCMGNLTIIAPTLSLGTPVYHVRPKPKADADPDNLNPATKALARLSQIQTAQDLIDQFPGIDPDAADFGAKTISTLTAYIAGLPADGSSTSGGQPTPPAPIPDQAWGGDLSGGALQLRDADVLLATAPAGVRTAMRAGPRLDVVGAVEDVAGDVLHAMEAGLEAIGEFVFSVTKDVLRFAIKIAGKWFHFIVDTISAALKLIDWVFRLLKVGLEALIAFLGFIFAWDDIVETHKVFANIAHQTFDMMRNRLPAIQKRIDQAFGEALEAVDSLGDNPLRAVPSDVSSISVEDVKASAGETAAPAASSADLYSAGGGFAYYQLLHGGILDMPVSEAGSGPQDLADFINDTLVPTLDQVSDEFKTMFETLIAKYQAGTLTFGDVFGMLTKVLVETAMEVVQVVIDGLVTLAEILFNLIDDVLFGEIKIPLLTPLYERVTGGSEMSLMDGFCLLLSIPATIAYKVVAGKAPFAEGTGGLDTADSYAAILDILNGQDNERVQSASRLTSSQWVLLYSQVGGIFATVNALANAVAFEGEVIAAARGPVMDKVCMACLVGYMAGSIPVAQDDRGQQILADLVYCGNIFDSMFVGLLFFGGVRLDEPLESGGTARTEILKVQASYELVMAFGDLIAYTLTFIDRMEKEEGTERATDGVTYAQDLTYVVALTSGAVAALLGDEGAEVTAVLLVLKLAAQFTTTGLAMFRVADTIYNDIRYDVL